MQALSLSRLELFKRWLVVLATITLFALLLLPMVALAQGEAPPPPPPGINPTLWQALVALVGFAVTTLVGIVGAAVRAKSKDSTYWSALNRAWTVVQAVVAHVEVELRPLVAEALADGSLSPEEAKRLKAQALTMIRASLGNELDVLQKGGMGDTTLEVLLSGLVERAVALLKTTPAPAPLAPPQVSP